MTILTMPTKIVNAITMDLNVVASVDLKLLLIKQIQHLDNLYPYFSPVRVFNERGRSSGNLTYGYSDGSKTKFDIHEHNYAHTYLVFPANLLKAGLSKFPTT